MRKANLRLSFKGGDETLPYHSVTSFCIAKSYTLLVVFLKLKYSWTNLRQNPEKN
jgi:hypothetical protein